MTCINWSNKLNSWLASYPHGRGTRLTPGTMYCIQKWKSDEKWGRPRMTLGGRREGGGGGRGRVRGMYTGSDP